MIEVIMCEKTHHPQLEFEEVEANPQANSADEALEDLLDRKHDLNFNIGRSIRYHKARQRFFDLLDKFSNFILIFFGSSSVYVLSQHNTDLAMWLGISVSVVSALSLVFGFSTKARDHFDFSKQYAVLERRLIKEPLSDKLLKSVEGEIRAIESNEPNVLRALNDLCWNEEALAQGASDKELKKVSPCRILTCQLY